MAGPAYTFLVTKLLTGEIIDEVELQSFHWNELYNRPGAGAGTIRIDDRTATRQNFASWENGLWVRQGDQIVWGGFMGSVAPVSGTRVLNVPVRGFEEYFRTRFLHSIQGMSHATLSKSVIKWTNKDVFLIVEDMFAHAQSFPSGNIGIEIEYDDLSGNITTVSYNSFEYKPIGVAFEQLADNINGFDWRYTFGWNGTKPQCKIRLSPVPQGRRTQFVLEYDHKPGAKNIMSFDAEAEEVPANGVAAVGAGDGAAMLRTYVADLNTGMPLYESMISYKDVTRIETLTNHANKHLVRNKVPVHQVTVTVDPNLEPSFTEFICGDEMLLRVDDGWQQYNDYYRVFEKSMRLSKEQDLELKLSLEKVGS
jgi:hypothetical protein